MPVGKPPATPLADRGFARSVRPVTAQTMIVTAADGLDAGEVRVPVRDGEMAAYCARPAGGEQLPTILVVQEIFGVHEHIRDVCRRLARLGYLAIAPELYARQGDPRQFSDVAELLAQIVARVPDQQVMADLDACADWAAAHGGDAARLGITGFCWGGRITWLYCAHNRQLKAGVAWYGKLAPAATANCPRQPVELAGELQAPVLGLYGGGDASIPLADVAHMQAALATGSAAAQASSIHVYAGAPHAFHADYRPTYRRPEAEDGWQRLQAWFSRLGL